jgi:hypothetical protein
MTKCHIRIKQKRTRARVRGRGSHPNSIGTDWVASYYTPRPRSEYINVIDQGRSLPALSMLSTVGNHIHPGSPRPRDGLCARLTIFGLGGYQPCMVTVHPRSKHNNLDRV